MRISLLYVIIFAVAILFFGGCADEPDTLVTESSVTTTVTEFASSSFASYTIISLNPFKSSTDPCSPCPIDPGTGVLPKPPYPVSVVFYQVAALNRENAVISLPRFILASPLSVTVDESITHEFLLNGTVGDTETKTCGDPEQNICIVLTAVEVIFRTATGAEAFNAAFLAARTTP
ncbi:MAG: hypothetical protein HYY60_01815 [Parcubacteria group bacterium]|nr:hypothetical protein [Parcubacteria group bacterium]